MPGLDDYGSIISSGMGLVPDFAKSQAAEVGLDTEKLRQKLATVQIAGELTKLQRAQSFQTDLAGVKSNPDATAISGLIMKYPEFADQLKSGWDVKDKAAQTADLTQLGQLYSAGSSGNWDLVSKTAHARFDADKAAGKADPGDEAFLQQIDAAKDGGEPQRKAVLAAIGTHLAAVTGPEHFGTVYGALKGGYTLDQGAARYDDAGNLVAHSPFIKDADGNIRQWTDGAASDAASPSAPASGSGKGPVMTPAAETVASTLASGGMPAPVVAGFMGNFHAEGGWDGAQGDGGSASGIAQWRNARAANFQKIIGKPVTDADHADQAKFVLYEMQHPEEAGMTTKQRDAIMAAKTPAQAAALIDQFYERSDGKDRSVRMSAANAFAGVQGGTAAAAQTGGQFPIVIPGKQPTTRTLTAQEAAARGLPTNQVYQLDTSTGEVKPVANTVVKPGSEQPAGQELEDAATQYLLTGQMPALGMGSGGLKTQILARRSTIMKRLGITAEQLPAFQAQYGADKSALQKNNELLSNLQSSENALKANAQQVWSTHRTLVQDGIVADNPWLSRKQITYYQNFGSPDQKAHVKSYLDAVNAYSTEYSKFMTAANGMGGSAGPSDAARSQAGELNDVGLAATPLLAHLRQGLTEAVNKRNGVQKQKEQLQHKLSSYLHPYTGGGDHVSAQDLPKGARVVGTYQGRRVIEVNGKRMVEQ